MSTATRDNITKLYVATFNRAPDAAGLNYWVNTGMSIEDISQSFFDQPETQTLYPVGTATTAFVTSVYQNLFNRAPDQAGLDYWTNELNTHSISNQNFILAVMNGALAADATILENKKTVGLSFVDAGLDDVALARTVMADVDDTTASVDAATSEVNSTVVSNAVSNLDVTFDFSPTWLAGRTLYEAWDDNENGTVGTIDSMASMVFSSTNNTVQVTDLVNGESSIGTYSVDSAGVISIVESWGTWYMKAVFEHTADNYILADPSDDYATLYNDSLVGIGYNDNTGFEYLFFNQADALAAIGEEAPGSLMPYEQISNFVDVATTLGVNPAHSTVMQAWSHLA